MGNNYYYVQQPPKNNGVGIAALVCGLVSLCCCNPLYLVSLAAIVLGIIGMCTKGCSTGLSLSGLLWSVGNETVGTIVFSAKEEGRILLTASIAIVLIILVVVINLFVNSQTDKD